MTDLGGKSRRYRPKVQYSFSAQAGKLRYFSDYNSTLIERIRRRRAAKTNSRIFAHTRWDAIPVAAALLHCAYFFGMFYLLPRPALGHAHSRFSSTQSAFLGTSTAFPTTSFTIRTSIPRCSIVYSVSWNQSQPALAKSSTNAFTCSITKQIPTVI